MAGKREERSEQFGERLTDGQRESFESFLTDYRRHILLDRKQTELLLQDARLAVMSLLGRGVPFQEALKRLDPSNLGGFYARPPVVWYPLDDAAKIYPLSMKHGQMSLFRLSACLKEEVDPALLQMALTFTIKRFPFFATTVKKGFFWHYLDSSRRRYPVERETKSPCAPLTIGRSGSPSFRVLFFRNRVSVEYFHILTDGTGGLVFLKTLVCEYLSLVHGISFDADEGTLDVNGTPVDEESSNRFPLTVHGKSRGSGYRSGPALQLGGKLSGERPCRIIQFQIDAKRLREVAKSKGGSVTSYMLSRIFLACKYATDETDGDFSIQTPVNMRKFYPSRTLRNFSMYCGIRVPASAIDDRTEIFGEINRQLQEKASKEAMSEMMRSTERIVSGTRYVPLFIKKPIALIAYGLLGDRAFTTTLSNLGVVTIPRPCGDHIRSLDFILGTVQTNRCALSLITFGETATLSVTKLTSDPSFEEALRLVLEKDGIPVRAEGSELCEN